MLRKYFKEGLEDNSFLGTLNFKNKMDPMFHFTLNIFIFYFNNLIFYNLNRSNIHEKQRKSWLKLTCDTSIV